MLLAALLVGRRARPGAPARAPVTQVRLADGRVLDAQQWQQPAARTRPSRELLCQGAARGTRDQRRRGRPARTWWPAGRCARCTGSPRPPSGCPARRWTSGSATCGADDEVAELAATFDAMLDRLNDVVREPETVRRQRLARTAHPAGGHADRDRRDADRPRGRRRRVPADGQRGPRRAPSGPTPWSTRCWCWPAPRRRPAGGWSARCRPTCPPGSPSALSSMPPGGRPDQPGRRPPTSQPAPVVGDPSLLDRLAGNLIENAVRYNHLHGGCGCAPARTTSHAWLVVGNTGFEVEPADVPGPVRAVPPGRLGAHRRRAAPASACRSCARCATPTAVRSPPSAQPGRRTGGDRHPARRPRPPRSWPRRRAVPARVAP